MFLSIVVVNSNDDGALEKTLKSIDFSSNRNDSFEVIIIDGGKGHSHKRAHTFLRSKNLTIIKEPDEGIFDAMNKGFSMSKGEWVNFLNSGDIYNPNFRIDSIQRALQESSNIWAVGNSQIYVKRRLTDWRPSQINFFRFRLGLNSYPHQATFYHRRELVKLLNEPFNATDSVADWSLSYYLLLKRPPQYLNIYISINEEAGKSRKNPLFNWSRDIVRTRQQLNRLITKCFFTDFVFQFTVGVLSRAKNRI